MIEHENYSISTLNTTIHNRENFDCGNESLNNFLKKLANTNSKVRMNKTYVLTEKNSSEIIGYYSIAATAINFDAIISEDKKRLPMYQVYPASLIARLAIDKKYQGKKLGGLLIKDIVLRTDLLSHEMGMAFVMVEAIDDKAINFYKHFGFKETTEKRILYLPLN